MQEIWSWYEIFIEHGPIGPIFCSQIFETDIQKKSHEIGFIKYGHDMRYS